MQKILLFLLIIFCIFNIVYAEQDWSDNIMNIIIDIGDNITESNYTHYKFLALKEAICEYLKPIGNIEKKQEFSNKVLTKVAIGINEQDISYLNEVLLFLQISMRKFDRVYYIIP